MHRGRSGENAATRARPVGRRREFEVLDGLLAALPDRGAALLLCGDPGIGKSMLLEYAAQRGRAQVLRARGVESEAVLPYAVLAEVLLPLRKHFAELPASQRRALEACFALSDATGPDLYAVCAGALGVLAAAGEEDPLVVLVDDLHWADPSSRQVLQFVARRLESERVVLVMAARSGPGGGTAWEGVPQLTLSGLDRDACEELLRGLGLDPAEPAAARIVELSQGSPLVLVEYAAMLRDSRGSGSDPWGTVWEAPGPLVERAWQRPLQALPRETREALVYVAASRSGDIPVLERAFAAVGLPMAALGPAEEAGLVLVEPEGGYRLRHPVLRPLVLRGCPLGQRLQVYRVLAESSPADLRAWYLAAAATGPDEEVAETLAAEAEQARRLGALGTAAETWYRAAELSPAPYDRAVRLLHAASDGFHSGAVRDAVRWCVQALRWSRDPRLTADIELLRGQACAWLGDPAQAHRLLVSAAEAVRPADPARAGVLYGAATLPAAMSGHVPLALELAREFSGLADAAPADGHGAVQRRQQLATVLLGAAQALAGQVQEGRELLLRERAALPMATTPELQQVTVQIGEGLSWVDEDTAARSLLSEVVDRIRRGGSPGMLPYALAGRCEVDSWRHWTAARADGAEAVRWARELGQAAMSGYALVLLARLDGQRGDRSACEEHIAAYRGHGGGPGTHGLEVFALGALGSAAFTAGDLDDCVLHFERAFALAQDSGMANPNMLTFVADLTEVHVRSGRRDRAAELVAWLEERAGATGLAWPEAAAARCRALLATGPDEAAEWLAAADRAHTRREMVFEQARTRLVHGEVLRRLRRPAAARTPLLAAHAAFTALGARPWAARAEAELAAAGHRTVPQGTVAPLTELLTAQELQVARAIAEGLSNVEAASALFMSRKTVEAHLTRVYRKLGIRSRSDLARTLARAGVVR
ncbi:AAA family ATPase [Streptomyces sp. NPDC005820]|uniref:AAA family ATPase n=1 Tax=Streptomyces sp. NPDC005820 TaxID=3157069 RepID=UPI0033C2BCC4